MKVNRYEIANTLFNEGFNCAQALLVAYGTGLGINRDIALKIASTFGGGVGRTGETCGAVTGALMIIGLKYGITKPDFENKMRPYNIVEKFINQFKTRNNAHSISCNELIGFRIFPDRPLNRSERDIIQKRCPQYVQDAARIIEEILGDQDA
jgi:C_GCAxxG_C_C family probable redox protein